MSTNSSIEWTEATWNPLLGCERVSPGCDRCYAITTATIRAGNPHPRIAAAFEGLTERRDGRLDWTGRINLLPDRLAQPLTWRKPKRIFVNSQADLFHKDVPDTYIAQVFAVMGLASQHVFQVLTKRHARMRSLLNSPAFRIAVLDQAYLLTVGEVNGVEVPRQVAATYRQRRDAAQRGEVDSALLGWPLPNVWLGVSVEDQHWADIRIPALLDTPSAVRWLSCEPLLAPVDLRRWLAGSPVAGQCIDIDGAQWHEACDRCRPLSWVVVGGESGPGARPMHPDWARLLRDQCVAAGVRYFFKQHGEWMPIGPLYAQGDDEQEADDARMDAVCWEIDGKREVIELERSGYIPRGHQPRDSRTWLMVRVGKKSAGRELDGRTWDEYPQTPVVVTS